MRRSLHTEQGYDEDGLYVKLSIAELRQLIEEGITPDELGGLFLEALSIESDEEGNILFEKDTPKKKRKSQSGNLGCTTNAYLC